MAENLPFEILKGKTLFHVGLDEIRNTILFICSDGERYLMHHYQNCCESVTIYDVAGDIRSLLGSPITVAETRKSQDNPPKHTDEKWEWTFYELATNQGAVTITWYGKSNGYYSIEVDFEKYEDDKEIND